MILKVILKKLSNYSSKLTKKIVTCLLLRSFFNWIYADLIFRDDFMTKIELYKKILGISRNTKTILVLSIPQKKTNL